MQNDFINQKGSQSPLDQRYTFKIYILVKKLMDSFEMYLKLSLRTTYVFYLF